MNKPSFFNPFRESLTTPCMFPALVIVVGTGASMSLQRLPAQSTLEFLVFGINLRCVIGTLGCDTGFRLHMSMVVTDGGLL